MKGGESLPLQLKQEVMRLRREVKALAAERDSCRRYRNILQGRIEDLRDLLRRVLVTEFQGDDNGVVCLEHNEDPICEEIEGVLSEPCNRPKNTTSPTEGPSTAG